MDEKEDFLERTLIQDLKKANLSNLTIEQKEEFSEEISKKKTFSKSKFLASLSVFILIIMILLGFLAYVFMVESIHSIKPELDKPQTYNIINTERVEYLLQEGGAYKLHSFLGDSAKIVIWITNTGQKFTATVDSDLVIEEKNSESYDILISLEDNIFNEIYQNNETNKEIKRQISRKRLNIEKNSNPFKLAIKGFQGMNHALDPVEKKLFIFTSNQLRLIYMVVMIILLITTLFYLRKE